MKTAQLDTTKNSSQTTSASHKSRPVNTTIYLDNHATTPLDPIVLDTMLPYLKENFGNPASTHSYGVRAQYAVEQARTQVATAINAHEDEILFTAGATESNNFAIKGVFDYYRGSKPHFIVSNIEHKCILEAVKHIKKQGAQLTVLKADERGLIAPEQLRKALKPHTVLVSIMFANNEIGSINAVRELAEISHKQGALFHTDAAQAVGKVPIDVEELGIDLLSASGHKFYGPKGVGFIYIKKSAQQSITPLLDGGGQEAHLRSGTLNVPGIVGLGKAIELATQNMSPQFEHYLTLRNQLYERFLAAFPDMLLNGPEILPTADFKRSADVSKIASTLQRLPHNLNITLPSVDRADLGKIYSVAFSSTSACSSGDVEPSYVLLAIGRTAHEAQVSLRFGIGRFTTEADVNDAANIFIEALQTS
jgi:cysteine desulfurase